MRSPLVALALSTNYTALGPALGPPWPCNSATVSVCPALLRTPNTLLIRHDTFRGEELFEEAAGPGGQEARAGQTGLLRQGFPAGIGERVRHPQIAAVDVVFDQQQPAAGLEAPRNAADHVGLAGVRDEVQGVGHHGAVERRQRVGQGPGEVGFDGVQRDAGEAPLGFAGQLAQCAGVAVDGVNRAAGAEQVGQRQCKSPLPRAEVGPDVGARRDAWAEEAYVVRVVHSKSVISNW
jgi:hypothetical protein